MVYSIETFTKIIAYNWKEDYVTDKHTEVLKENDERNSQFFKQYLEVVETVQNCRLLNKIIFHQIKNVAIKIYPQGKDLIQRLPLKITSG